MLSTTNMTKFWKECEMWNRAHNVHRKYHVSNHGRHRTSWTKKAHLSIRKRMTLWDWSRHALMSSRIRTWRGQNGHVAWGLEYQGELSASHHRQRRLQDYSEYERKHSKWPSNSINLVWGWILREKQMIKEVEQYFENQDSTLD